MWGSGRRFASATTRSAITVAVAADRSAVWTGPVIVMLRDKRIDWATILPALTGFARVAVAAGWVGLVVAELVLRLAGLPTGATNRARSAYDIDDEEPGPYRPGAGIDVEWPPEAAEHEHHNSRGMRGAEPR